MLTAASAESDLTKSVRSAQRYQSETVLGVSICSDGKTFWRRVSDCGRSAVCELL